MKITHRTRVKDILPLLTEKRMEYLLERIPEYPLNKPILSLTIGEFAEILMDEQAYMMKILNPRERAYIAFGQLKSFKRQMEEISAWMKKYEIKQSEEERRAAIGIEFPDFIAKILIIVVQFFGLHSFKEAEQIPLADYLIILQEQSSSIRYQRNYSKIIEQKHGK